MKYEENVWYGWNGGECPVHPDTVVRVSFKAPPEEYQANPFKGDSRAGDIAWYHDGCNDDVVAFRVIKEHREPREFWVTKQTLFDLDGNISGYAYHQSSEKDGDFKVREVIE